jgi:hypothetical protein
MEFSFQTARFLNQMNNYHNLKKQSILSVVYVAKETNHLMPAGRSLSPTYIFSFLKVQGKDLRHV